MPLINLLIISTTVALILFTIFPRKYSKIFLLINFLILFVVQFQTTRIATVFEYSNLEQVIIQRRHDIAPKLVRHLDPPQFYRFREYFFLLFRSMSPFLILGIYSYIQKPIKLITILLFTTFLLFFLIGPNGKYGPILLTPFIYFLTLYALRLVKK